MKVCKFGGSSVASAEQIVKVIGIVTADPARRVVVVSAPGKRFSGDDKVTDLLISCAVRVLDGDTAAEEVRRVVERFELIREDLALDESLVNFVREELKRRLSAPIANPAAFTDSIKALGEEFSARFCAAAFTKRGYPAVYVDPKESGMFLSEEFGNAQLMPEAYELLKNAISPIQEIVIYPGFFGYTRKGNVATFPRGGSDITGAILAAALRADVYENFTDVDSVFPVDPRIVPEVNAGISEMTYRELRELSYSGFGVFHDEAVQPAVRAGIPINIRNTNHPEAPGTMVLATRKTVPGRVIGLSSSTGFGTLYVSKYLMNREIGFAAHVLSILADEKISFEHMPTGIDSISIVLRDSVFGEATREHVMARIREELNVDEVSYTSGLALIMVVGEGMRETVGTCRHVVSVLSEAGVNIEVINQGSSEISLMFGIRETSLQTAIRALYHEFFD